MAKAKSKAQPQDEDLESRRRIRESLDENLLVEAAAGTGKTTCIVERMVNLIASGQCCVENMVAVTFTRKAASELRERFQIRVQQRLRRRSIPIPVLPTKGLGCWSLASVVAICSSVPFIVFAAICFDSDPSNLISTQTFAS